MKKLDKFTPCPHCGRYDNRGVTIDAVIIRDDKVLLIKRGSELFTGFWGTPGGYVEWDESVEDAVSREVREEVGLQVSKVILVGVYSAPTRHPKQAINMLYVVEVFDGEPKSGGDAKEVKWFSLDSLPKEMAFDHKQNIIDAKKILWPQE